MSEEMEIAKQWLGKARNDLLNADNNLKAQDVCGLCAGSYSISGFASYFLFLSSPLLGRPFNRVVV